MNVQPNSHSCEISVLGALRVLLDGAVVDLPRSKKTRALLAYLAVAGHSGANRDDICRLLFADTNDPRGSLRWSVSRLRSAFGDARKELLITEADRLKIAEGISVDLSHLVQLVDEQHPEPDQQELIRLINFEQSISGSFLDGLELDGNTEFETWRLATRYQCADLRADMLRSIIRGLSGETRAIEFARRLISIDSTNERSWSTLVRLLKLAGHNGDAREAYELAHRELSREGVPLTGELRSAMSPNRHATSLIEEAAAKSDSRPSVTVLRSEAGVDVDGSLVRQVYSGITAAATRNKSCRMLIPYSTDPQSAAKDNDVDMVLRSHVYRGSGCVEVHVDLVRGTTGESLFSWQLSVPDLESSDLADSVSRYFSSHFEFDLIIAQINVARQKPDEQQTARDRFLLALPLIYSPEGMRADEALAELQQALEEDPRLAPALCAAGWVRTTHPSYNALPAELLITSQMVRRAVEIGQDDPFVLGLAAVVIAHADLDVATGEDLVQRALSLNGESPAALIAGAYTAHYSGEYQRSLELLELLDALDAAGPFRFFAYTCRAMNYYQLDCLEDAEHWSRRALGHNPKFIVTLRILAASQACLGRLTQARQTIAEMLALDVSETLEFIRQRSPYQEPGAREKLCADLKSAGLPERREKAN